MISTAPRPPSVRSMTTDSGDPISALLRPPPGETESARQLRLQREAEAKRISDRIDEELRLEEKRFRKRKEDVKVRRVLQSGLYLCGLVVGFLFRCLIPCDWPRDLLRVTGSRFYR